MRKIFFLMSILVSASLWTNAQSKVFKEVSDEISSQIKPIMQDNALVGYLVFTQLERVSVDSLNYKMTIMDENLNDIGTINFREENLDLQAAAFEQDVLCLAYLKSNIIGKQFKNKKEYKAALPKAKNFVVTQFLGLDGKIIKTNSIKADVDMQEEPLYNATRNLVGAGKLKKKLQLKNISQKGFACFYGDNISNQLITYNVSGNEVWKKKIVEAKHFYLHTSAEDIYLLSKNSVDSDEGGYEVAGYGFSENAKYDKIVLKDKKGNSLKVVTFDNDPSTGKLYITGNIINPSMRGISTIKDVTKGPYLGVFTTSINGPKKSDVKENFSYWDDGSNASITTRGKFAESDGYSVINDGFKDRQGNTYFVGSSVIKRTKWGAIASCVVLAPLIVVSPMILMTGGTTKCKVTDAMVLKQTPNGKLSYENTIPCNSTSFIPGRAPMALYGPQKSFYRVSNSNTKNDYVIVDDVKDIVIYNVTQKKVAKTIPHKDGNIKTYVYPAKEGHIMVSEYNKKEKYTRFSIESL